MPKGPTKGSPPKPPHPGDLIKVIRMLAKAERVAFSSHVLDERLDERGFDIGDIFEILRVGDIDGAIKPGKNRDEWRCLVVGNLKWSPREVGVATVVVRQDRLIVATVEWIDP